MPDTPRFLPYPYGRNLLFAMLYGFVGMFFLIGLGYVLGGRDHFSTPSLMAAGQVPGGPYTWGTLGMLFTSLTALGIYFRNPFRAFIPAIAQAIWCYSLGIFALSVTHWTVKPGVPTAPLSSPIFFVGSGVLFSLIGGIFLSVWLYRENHDAE